MTHEETCARKHKIKWKRKASSIASKMTRTLGTKIVPYQCRVCGYWHVGHEPEKMTRKRKRREAKLESIRKIKRSIVGRMVSGDEVAAFFIDIEKNYSER